MHIGMFPEVDWIPVDLLSNVLVDLAAYTSNIDPGSLDTLQNIGSVESKFSVYETRIPPPGKHYSSALCRPFG